LNQFVLSSDSRHAYVLQADVFDLDVADARVTPFGLGFFPKNLNISADDRLLFLRKDAYEVCIFDLSTQSCRGRFVSMAGAGP
jgi:hypothetical protein